MVLDRKIAYVDLSDGSYEIRKIPVAWMKNFLGGRGINMYLLSKSYASTPDPFSPHNPLLFGAGLLSGLPGFGSRVNFTSRSPESGHLGDSNMGGESGAELIKAGLSHLVITGKSKKPPQRLSLSSIGLSTSEKACLVSSRRWPRGRCLVTATSVCLNETLQDTMRRLQVRRAKDQFHWEWTRDPSALDAILRPIVHAAAELLVQRERSKVRQCANMPVCQWLFLDKSKNRSRRWCSMDLCGSRDKVKRYYHRKKQAS